MNEPRVFVGRQAELDRFLQILEDPRGQAVVVVGQAGMGKTWLLDKMTELATQHPTLKCGCVRYEVTPTDSPDATMELMMDNAFEAARTSEGSFDKTDRRRTQWIALLKVVVPKGRDLADLIASLRRDPQKHTREQFIERLQLISKRMGPDCRALFVIDPEKYMCKSCADSWRLVVRELPDKIKFIFAQRPEDELVNSSTFMALDNIARLPTEPLGILAAEEVDELVRLLAADVGQSVDTLQKAVTTYQGHPYAIQAALGIVKETGRAEDLPQDPTPEAIAATQWQHVSHNDDAIRLFEVYAILEVGVPDDVVQAVSGLDAVVVKRLRSDTYLRGLLREEGQGRQIYHAILADYVRGQIAQGEQKTLHARAASVFRDSLMEARKQHRAPSALAAVRLPEHVLAVGGSDAFVAAFVNECTAALLDIGLLDAAMSLSQRSLQLVQKRTREEAMVIANLGLILRTRGDLDGAEKMQKQAMFMNQTLGRPEALSGNYANLGLIFMTRGDTNEAEKMFNRAIEIDRMLGQRENLVGEYGNLGLIYRMRGDLNKAEEMLNESLRISQGLGQLEGTGNYYGNLGAIYLTRGDLDKAEKMMNRALEIDRKLGRLEGIADHYANLGAICLTREDLDVAEKMFEKALEIDRKLGRLQGIASAFGNLGIVCRMRGDLDKAEEMHRQALAIHLKLGWFEGTANEYGNLGVICLTRGDLDEAETRFKMALDINLKAGRLEGVANGYRSLGAVSQARGEFAKARGFWEQAIALYQKIGVRDKLRTVQTWIDGLPKTEKSP